MTNEEFLWLEVLHFCIQGLQIAPNVRKQYVRHRRWISRIPLTGTSAITAEVVNGGQPSCQSIACWLGNTYRMGLIQDFGSCLYPESKNSVGYYLPKRWAGDWTRFRYSPSKTTDACVLYDLYPYPWIYVRQYVVTWRPRIIKQTNKQTNKQT